VGQMGALQTEVGSAAVAAELVENLHEQYAKAIRRYCLRRLHSPEEADDATQVVYLTAYRCLAEGVEPRAEGAWLFKIAENVVLQRRRALARRARVEYAVDVGRMADTLVAPALEATPELDGVREAVATMPESQRQAIVLREWYGLSYREVANELGVSSTAVEALIFRARRGLVRRLEVRNRLTQNGKRFGFLLPAGPLKYLFGGGGIGAKVVVGAASIAFVAATTQPQAPGIVLAAATTARGATTAYAPVATHYQHHRLGGPTHRLRTPAPAPRRWSDEPAGSGAPAAPLVPDAGGWRGVSGPTSPPAAVAESGSAAAGGTDLGVGSNATPPAPDSGGSVAPDTAATPSVTPATTPSDGPSATTPSGKTPPAVGRTPGATPPGHDDGPRGNSGPSGLPGSSPGLANGQGNGNGNGRANGHGAPTDTAPPLTPGQVGDSGGPGSSAPAAAS
jgi:RNA polymerase sigma-70 factor, ECF subfamily